MDHLPPLSPTKGRTSPTALASPRPIKTAECLAPGPVHLPGVDRARDPILGTMIQYTRVTPLPSAGQRRSNNHKAVHPGSMFEDTSVRRNFYIIAPDWPSESHSARRMSARPRAMYSWDSRPAFHPLNDYVVPMLERRRSCDSRLNDALLSARASATTNRGRHVSTHAHGSMKATPPTLSRDDPMRASLPAQTLKREFSKPNQTSSQFYKSMLANELMSPRRDVTYLMQY